MGHNKPYLKTVLPNIALLTVSLLVSLLGAELFCRWLAHYPQDVSVNSQPAPVLTGTYTQDYFIPHPALGYGPKINHSVSAKLTHKEQILYDVEYKINAQGLRATSEALSAPTLLFFGGSYMFGEGVKQQETLPCQLLKIMEYHYSGLNYGFHGYGPHQMLRALELQYPKKDGADTVAAAIFQTAPWHLDRAAGLSAWDQSGPQYQLKKSGQVVYKGPFVSKNRQKWTNSIKKRSALFRLVYEKIQQLKRTETQQMIKLYIGILKQARTIIATDYQAPLYVLFWDDPYRLDGQDMTPLLLQALTEANFEVIRVSESTELLTPASRQIPVDGHPSASAHYFNALALSKKLG